MLWFFIGIGLLFIGLGYAVTPNNARYLLSGYNTLSDSEQKRVDIVAYLKLFKIFHVALGLSVGILCFFVSYVFSPLVAVCILLSLIFLGYTVFISLTRHYFSQRNRYADYIVQAVLLIVWGVIGYSLWQGGQHNTIVLKEDAIIIDGQYGQSISISLIDTLIVEQFLPSLTFKMNGLSIGEIKKGYFKHNHYNKVLVYLHSNAVPVLHISTKDNQHIYYNHDTLDVHLFVQNFYSRVDH